jgi:phosphoribosylformylglycinamidine synthase
MTSYSRLEENRPWENGMVERKWLYQTPMDILIKKLGASDFGNKFGQPLLQVLYLLSNMKMHVN